MRAIFEAGIGCDRAVVLEDGQLVEAHLERPGVRVGDIWEARLYSVTNGVGDLHMPGGPRLDPLPGWATEGSVVEVEIVREAIQEPDRYRPPVLTAVNTAADGAAARVGEGPRRSGYITRNAENGGHRLRAGPGLRQRLVSRGIRVTDQPSHGSDLLESAGWSEVFEEARTGRVAFPGGELVIERTAAFEAVDVDGGLEPPELALAATRAIGAAVRRMDITGSIVVDFPTLGSRAARLATDAALDAALPRPFERTAMNGFGLVQIIRPKLRASLMDHAQASPAAAEALALLRIAARATGPGITMLTAHPEVLNRITLDWLAMLTRRTGRATALRYDPALAISTWHVHVQAA